jgi:hypothetical protein
MPHESPHVNPQKMYLFQRVNLKTVLWNALVGILVVIPIAALLLGIKSALLIQTPAFTAYSLRGLQTAITCFQVFRKRRQFRWLISTLAVVYLAIIGSLLAILAMFRIADYPLLLLSILVLPLVIFDRIAHRSKL